MSFFAYVLSGAVLTLGALAGTGTGLAIANTTSSSLTNDQRLALAVFSGFGAFLVPAVISVALWLLTNIAKDNRYVVQLLEFDVNWRFKQVEPGVEADRQPPEASRASDQMDAPPPTSA